MPKVLNARDVDARNAPKTAVYVGRPSKWGNPFHIGPHGTREQVIERYRSWIKFHPTLMKELDELKGRDLMCYCAPEACHADVLLELANK